MNEKIETFTSIALQQGAHAHVSMLPLLRKGAA